MEKKFSVFFIALLFSVLVFVSISNPSKAQTESSIPSIPDFTVEFIDSSYDAPATSSIDPYTGQIIINPSYRVENKTIIVSIKNQPYVYDSDIDTLYYNIRVKGYYADDWIALFPPADIPLKPSNSDYTIVSFPITISPTHPEQGYSLEAYDAIRGSYDARLNGLPANAQVDFQVEAMIGYVSRTTEFASWHFTGKESGWSDTQTITINSNQSQTSTNDKLDEQSAIAQVGFNWTDIALLTVTGVIVVLLIVNIMLILRRRGAYSKMGITGFKTSTQ